ncbi:hypothetical protein [Streptomyces chiangmaiensis]|uniref:hypothetical protein n=1 Tax=Streptomyces chiangmaiensis TaxID=766497 RepID=UPI0038B61568
MARTAGPDPVFLNGDAFSDTMKNQVADLIEQRFGGRPDYLIYPNREGRHRDRRRTTAGSWDRARCAWRIIHLSSIY